MNLATLLAIRNRQQKVPPEVALKRIEAGYLRLCSRFSPVYQQTSPWYVGDSIKPYMFGPFRKTKNKMLEILMREWACDDTLDTVDVKSLEELLLAARTPVPVGDYLEDCTCTHCNESYTHCNDS